MGVGGSYTDACKRTSGAVEATKARNKKLRDEKKKSSGKGKKGRIDSTEEHWRSGRLQKE